MPGRLVHFEIPAHDAERAKRFYGDLFGWTFTSWDGPIEYHMSEAGGEPGCGLYPSESADTGPIVYFDVEDIQAGVARVREVGGTAEDPGPIPGVGWSAFCQDTEGNRFALFQSDESVPAEHGG